MIRRRLTVVLISLSLLLTSLALGASRGQMRAAGEIVLCRGGVVATVAVDARGKPVAIPHFCPDCALLALAAVAPPDAGSALKMDVPARVAASHASATGIASLYRSALPARGPPVTV